MLLTFLTFLLVTCEKFISNTVSNKTQVRNSKVSPFNLPVVKSLINAYVVALSNRFRTRWQRLITFKFVRNHVEQCTGMNVNLWIDCKSKFLITSSVLILMNASGLCFLLCTQI